MSGVGARALSLVCLLTAHTAGAFTVGPDGWTTLTPSPDSVLIHVSSGDGDDDNDGLSAAAPVATIIEGMRRLRDGLPDHLLLKRGDVWHETFGFWSKSGRSAAEPIVVRTYGTAAARPRVIANAEPALRGLDRRVNYLAFTGIHLEVENRPASLGPTGIRWLAPTNDLLIEDCLIEGFSTNVVVQGYFGPIENFQIRRCVLVDAVDTGTLSQGMYCENVDGILIEECVFDYNGWREGVSIQSIFNHNVYIHSGSKNLVARGNIFSRASSHGLQARPGGVVENNLFVRCPIACSYGYVLGGSDPTVGGVSGRVHGNVVLESNDIADKPRGIGIQVANINAAAGVAVTNNYFVRNDSVQPYGAAIELQAGNGLGIHNALVQGNVCYGYNTGLTAEGGTTKYSGTQIRSNCFMPLDSYSFVVHHRFDLDPARVTYLGNIYNSPRTASSWFRANGILYSLAGWQGLALDVTGVSGNGGFPDSSRSLEAYGALQGFPATVVGFMAEARKQSRHNWRPQCTAGQVIDYIRVGFGGSAAVQYSLETMTEGSGTITLNPEGGPYNQGQTVTCTAVPEPGHRFLYWHDDLLGELANPANVVMDRNKAVRAVFASEAEPLYSLNISIQGQGNVKLMPPGNAYPINTPVTLTALPQFEVLGNHFMRYEGDASGTTAVNTIIMSDYKSVTAVFEGVEDIDATSGTGLVIAIACVAILARRRLRGNIRR